MKTENTSNHTLHYFCKYTPIELMAGFGTQCVYANHMPAGFAASEQVVGVSTCGFGKALYDLTRTGGVHEMILTTCCDTIRSLASVLQREGKVDFLFLLDIPHIETSCTTDQLVAQLHRLVRTYSEYSGLTWDREKFLAALRLSHAQAIRPSRPYIALMGGRAGIELHRDCQRAMPLPVQNETCVAGRSIAAELPDESLSDKELIHWYAHELLAQLPCMRMLDRTGRRALLADPNLRGIIYHTIRFCDFYSFEYADLRNHTTVPILKIETDYTQSAGGQLQTRLDAFAEEIRETWRDEPGLFVRPGVPKKTPKTIQKEEKPMDRTGKYFAGIDSGSASTDVVILDENAHVVGKTILPTGAGARMSAEKALGAALDDAGLRREQITRVVTTGYGRTAIGNSDKSITEITCHARGAHFLDPTVRTVIDIGGQDSKVIILDERGHVVNFVMNDKCAAGTGRFLDMMARTMEMDLDQMSQRGLTYREDIHISSTCTVFAESEVVSLIADNKSTDDIVHGLDTAVARKTKSLAARAHGEGPYMMTGGVSRNRGLVKALEQQLGEPLIISEMAQLCGALGAALYAGEF